MRIAISNIAWDVAEDGAVAHLLQEYDVDAIDIAPGKYLPEPESATDADITYVREYWTRHGIEITGMQSLLFGTTGLNMFAESSSRERMLARLDAVCRIGGHLGASRLVFGSPRNRDCSGLSEAETQEKALSFFTKLGDIALSYGVIVCLEPNPVQYGANFMTTSAETADMVHLIAHPAIRMQLDTGAMTLNGEDPDAVIRTVSPLIGHIHASEPNLVPLGDAGTDHVAIAHCIAHSLPDHIVSIEMLPSASESHIASIERALKTARQTYGQPVVPS